MSSRLHGLPRLSALSLAIGLLAACSHQPVQQAPAANAAGAPRPAAVSAAQRQTGTLADLENRDIVIDKGASQAPTAAEALKNYQTAMELFQDPASRLDTLKRMAQLTMSASGTQLNSGGKAGKGSKPAAGAKPAADKAADKTAKPAAAPVKDDRDQAIADANLYGSVMGGRSILPAANPQPGGDGEEDASSKVSYTNAIRLYNQVLHDSVNPTERAEAYYELAKAYDMNTQRKESIETLRKLTEEYPNSPNFVEAEFRVAEDDFANGHFLGAADRYAIVAKLDSADFHDQAIYKQGWALYKASDYENALPIFFRVIDELRQKATHKLSAARMSNVNKLLDDTYRIISLSFMQMDGPHSVDAYFTKAGGTPYEADVYMNLGQTYQEKHQYRNAADTYEAFVARHPMDARAPEFSSATIRAYQDGGFPSEVIPAKENFVKRYGPGSEFWAVASDSVREANRPLLLGHLIDLAKFNHARAQQGGGADDYLKAADWYRQYLALKPEESDAITINELLAEALFSARHFGEAIVEFEKTAYDYNNPKAVDAAYFGLVGYQEMAKDFKGTPEEDKAWFDKRVASSMKFAQHFPGDSRTPTILEGLANDQISRKDMNGAMATAHVIVALQPPAPEKVQLESWEVIGDGEFDLNHPAEAEAAYVKVLAYQALAGEDRTKYKNRMAAAIYKQAEALRDKKDIDGAVANFLRVGTAGGDEKLVAGAQFDAATLLLDNKMYDKAIPILVSFRQKYPKHELSATIPDKLALAYEQTGQSGLAAREYENIANDNLKGNPELARQARWTAAGLYEKANQTADAMRTYQDYVGQFPTPLDVNAEAQYKLYGYYDSQKNATESQRWLESLAKTYDNAGSANTSRISYLGAMAHFKLCQPLYDNFANLALTQPLKKSIAVKKLAMQKVLEAYSKTSAIGVAEYKAAANYQIGETYRKMAADIRASERPPGLNQDELDQYAELLDEQASPLEDKSIDLYVANANLAKLNIYDDYVRKSFDALAKLSPGRYNKQEQPEPFVDVIY